MNQIQCNNPQRKYRNLDAFWQHTETSKRCKPGKVRKFVQIVKLMAKVEK